VRSFSPPIYIGMSKLFETSDKSRSIGVKRLEIPVYFFYVDYSLITRMEK